MKNNTDLKDELRSLFTIVNEENGSYKILLQDNGYEAYFIANNGFKGVGFVIGENFIDFKYNFENIVIKVEQRTLEDNNNKCVIELLSDKVYDTNEFIYICLKFIEPGKNGENRNLILTNPQEWVDKWKKLFGNQTGEEKVYSFIGELIVLKHLLNEGKDANLTTQGSHDIETIYENYEVKTSIMRYDSIIEIHSKNQLAKLNNNKLFLFFVRLEESQAGVSLNSLLFDLKLLNYDISKIENIIRELNSISRTKCYKIDEIRKYVIDDNFPKIVDESFVEKHLPLNIISLRYSVDLNGLAYEAIDSSKY